MRNKKQDEIRCLEYLEVIRWNGRVVCPYCNSDKVSSMRNEFRHHCNNCNSSFSVMTRTLFHKSKIPLSRWFEGIKTVIMLGDQVSTRGLAKQLSINKNSAFQLMRRIKSNLIADKKLIQGVMDYDN